MRVSLLHPGGVGFQHLCFRAVLQVVEGLKCPRFVQEKESIVTKGKHGRHLVGVLLLIGMVNDANGPVAALFQEILVCTRLVEQEQPVFRRLRAARQL